MDKKKWHPLSNQVEHKAYIRQLNKGFSRCVLCGRAEPVLFSSYSVIDGKFDVGKKYCLPCSWTVKGYAEGFITKERYYQSIEEHRKSGERFERESFY